jgi:hypothetical protein
MSGKKIPDNLEDLMRAHLEASNAYPTCLSHWYPVVSNIPEIKTPETAYFPIHFDDQLQALDRKLTPALLSTIEQIKVKAKEFGYPVFIKNSVFSGKHSWKYTCFVEKEEDIQDHFLAITDFAYTVGCDESLFWVVRKYLKPDALIHTDCDMPVTFERRYFIEDGKVVFHHPYWPESSLENQSPTPANWRDLLKITNEESDEEITLLKSLTEKVANVLPGNWSVDWLKVGTKWYLIDMAEKHKSYIWKDYDLGTKGL